ncbi:type VII secretion protein EccE [Dietzia sp. NPDC055343]
MSVREEDELMSAVPTLLGLAATVAATVLLTVLSPASLQPWVQLLVACGIAAVVAARRRGRPLLARDPAPRKVPVDVVDLRAPDRSVVGCVEGDSVVTTAVEISSGAYVPTVVGRDAPGDHRGGRLPLAAIARQLDQGGIVMEGIDVVVRGRRAARGDDGEVYAQLVGPLALISHRSVHLLLRFDLAPLALRGSAGAEAPLDHAVAVATERVRRALVHHGMPCRVLDATELAELYVEAEASPGDGRGLVLRPAADPRVVSDRLAAVRAAEITEVVRLRRVPGRTDVVDTVTTVGLTGISDGAVDEVTSGCHRLSNPAVLPVPGEPMPGTVSGCLDRRRIDRLDEAALPAHGAGQILGATRDGGAAAVQLAGPHLRSVLLTARPPVCRQVAFRAVAAGYRIAVVTDVPDRWRPLLRIGDEARYRIVHPDASDAGAPVDAVMWDVDGPLSEARIDALAGPGGPDVTPPTVIRVDADWELRGGRGLRSAAPPDLVLDGRIDGWISVEPRADESGMGESVRVSVVVGPGEEAFVGPAALTPAGAAPSASPGHP